MQNTATYKYIHTVHVIYHTSAQKYSECKTYTYETEREATTSEIIIFTTILYAHGTLYACRYAYTCKKRHQKVFTERIYDSKEYPDRQFMEAVHVQYCHRLLG